MWVCFEETLRLDQVTASEARCLLGEQNTATKNNRVARRTMAGPEGISKMADNRTPNTEQLTPMTTECHVIVDRLFVS
jgi:hypothetical protein